MVSISYEISRPLPINRPHAVSLRTHPESAVHSSRCLALSSGASFDARSPPSSSLLTHATRAPPAFVTQRCVFPAARCRARRRRDSRRRRDAPAAARPRAAVAPRDFVLLRSIAAPSSDERPSRDRASRGPSRSLATPRATRGVDARASAGSRGRRETFPGVRDDAGFLQRFSRRRRFARDAGTSRASVLRAA